ncbi:MAG TPA: WcaI family glycosyltransferase, partial [Bradyrhizobium sp.]|nr:WcaI family glycosyltransferase [Bradyrhizobium sp.]
IRAPIYVPRRPSGAKRLLHHGSFLLSAAIPILSTALTWRPDIVFAVAPSLLSASMAAAAARLSGAASWLHVQDLEVDAAFGLGMLKKQAVTQKLMLGVERSIMGAFDRVSTISPQMMMSLQQKGLAQERLREFRNWIDTSVIAPGSRQTGIRSSLGLAPTDIVALYSGSMSNKQGLELIIEAAGATRNSHPSLHFVLCGNGPMKPALLQMASGLGNVHFLDLQSEDRFSELLNTADIHLLPQKAQIADLVLPSKLAGMLSSGRPVVAMAAPATGIALEIEGAGLVVAPGDAQAFGSAVVALAADEALRARLGAVGRARAEQKWDRVSIVRSLEREFEALTQSPTTVTAPRPRQPAGPIRSIEQVATGSRRRPESASRPLARQLRQQATGARSAEE